MALGAGEALRTQADATSAPMHVDRTAPWTSSPWASVTHHGDGVILCNFQPQTEKPVGA